ncbi:MAG: type II secretion system protein [Patescibacteria group bacterium]
MINKLKIKNFKLKIPAKQAGFTVLESIVAIMVLSLSISGAFSAVQQSLSQSIIAKDEIKAFYLAQEAIEIIRNKRDTNQLSIISTGSGNWLDGISALAGDSCYFGKTCRADATGPNNIYLYSCSGSWDSCEILRQDSTTFLYNYDANDPTTNFKREIQIESINANEVAVTVRIIWTKGLIITREFKVKTSLFNWI